MFRSQRQMRLNELHDLQLRIVGCARHHRILSVMIWYLTRYSSYRFSSVKRLRDVVTVLRGAHGLRSHRSRNKTLVHQPQCTRMLLDRVSTLTHNGFLIHSINKSGALLHKWQLARMVGRQFRTLVMWMSVSCLSRVNGNCSLVTCVVQRTENTGGQHGRVASCYTIPRFVTETFTTQDANCLSSECRPVLGWSFANQHIPSVDCSTFRATFMSTRVQY